MARPPREPRTERGRAIIALLAKQGLTLTQGARRADVPFSTLYKAVHDEPPPRIGADVLAKIIRALGLPLRLLAPDLAKVV